MPWERIQWIESCQTEIEAKRIYSACFEPCYQQAEKEEAGYDFDLMLEDFNSILAEWKAWKIL